MGTNLRDAVTALAGREDPRLDDDHWHTVPGTDGDGSVLLLGVVHDHPSSVHRVRTVVEAVAPSVVALELPGVVLPHYERLAHEALDGAATEFAETGDGTVASTDGGTTIDAAVGEMSAAIMAADDAAVVAVDALDWRFFVELGRRARASDASLGTVRRALGNVAAVARNALDVRLGRTEDDAETGAAAHEVSTLDAPSTQAADERSHVERARTLHEAFARPKADVLLDEARESRMAAAIDGRRDEGTVVAVLGMQHLDGVAERLS